MRRRVRQPLVLAGVTDYSAGRFHESHRSDPHRAIAGAPQQAGVRVLLAHQPRTAVAAAEAGFDLQLSGHTHGGQFWPWNLFVPMQQPGLNEVGTVLVAQALGLSRQIASTLAIVRRARMLFWQLAGTALLVRHGVTTRRILHDRELNQQRVHHLTTRSNGTSD